jgi:2-polyprenyl-6-methoxyphenol hydroxylase-like FAD-dependent oxidoreductase
MPPTRAFDVVVVGGGLAGSVLAGVLAQSGLGVLVVEREARFRDRVRGEATWPWGVTEAIQLGLAEVLQQAGRVELAAVQFYERQRVVKTDPFERPLMIGFSHPRLQEALLTWAGSCGATTLRPAKATGYRLNGRPTVAVVADGREASYAARLVVGADGKLSAVRRWTGGATETDAEHHRFGGVLVTGLPTDWHVLADASTPPAGFFWFPQSAEATRLYFRMSAERLRETGVDRSFAAFVAVAAEFMPEGALAGARQAGPIGFFPNSNVWASRIAGNGVVLIGDAAGAADPSGGLGTSLLFRDVRELRDLLLSERDWEAAIEEFAGRRQRYYAVVREYDRWMSQLFAEEGAEADRRREAQTRAKEQDPTLGGFGVIEVQGPDGLVADEAARRRYFGETEAAAGQATAKTSETGR